MILSQDLETLLLSIEAQGPTAAYTWNNLLDLVAGSLHIDTFLDAYTFILIHFTSEERAAIDGPTNDNDALCMAVGLRQSLYRLLTCVVTTFQTTSCDQHDVIAEVENTRRRGEETSADYCSRFLAWCRGFENDKGIEHLLNRQYALGLQERIVRHQDEAESPGEIDCRA